MLGREVVDAQLGQVLLEGRGARRQALGLKDLWALTFRRVGRGPTVRRHCDPVGARGNVWGGNISPRLPRSDRHAFEPSAPPNQHTAVRLRLAGVAGPPWVVGTKGAGMADPRVGDTKIEGKKLLRWNGKAWEVIGKEPPPPRGNTPLERPDETAQADPDG